MLRLKRITKVYKTAAIKVEALKGIDLAFRKSEFVSILGPSGCGKTTMLNIIGGLDKYTTGDLIISGKSTKTFKDKDWDVYRNHRIGFIFQSYNLIPHQTILQNVELALTIAGISKEERQKRAKNALDRVGLEGIYNKRPNQLSGGQCQRVAIARALVNEPNILLADEPTGALDTKTSVQIMELIKEISKDKLVIMVTHNPELAEKYSTRIVRLLDGQVIEDTNPFSEDEEIREIEIEQARVDLENEVVKKERARMSWWTSFKLSARNLLSKSKRTILTCIAGSIGIIGVASVLGVSSGVTGYIESMQDDMLSGNPITISEESLDLATLMAKMSMGDKIDLIKEEGYVNVDSLIAFLSKTFIGEDSPMVNNKITPEYIEFLKQMPKEYYNAVNYSYGINVANNIYTNFTGGVKEDGSKTTMLTSVTGIKSIYTSVLEDKEEFAEYAQLITSLTTPMSQAIPNVDYIESQYNILEGKIATEPDEIMIVVDKNDRLVDLTLAQLGYYEQNEFIDLAVHAGKPESENDKWRFSYEELLNKEFYYYPNDEIYVYKDDLKTGNPMIDQIIEKTFEGSLYAYKSTEKFSIYGQEFESLRLDPNKGEKLKVVGIIQAKDDVSYGCLQSGFYYTQAFAEKMIADSLESEIIKYANEHANADGDFVFGVSDGNKFKDSILYGYEYTNYDKKTSVDMTVLMSSNTSNIMMGGMMGGSSSSTSFGPNIRELGGNDLPSTISIYPINFEEKNLVTDYLDIWNSEKDIQVGDKILTKADRDEITYVDNLELIINLINGMIQIVTIALVCFTALSLVVSSVMIAIITYVSVMERIKEIGVIRSLGGRKKDVSNLFNAETMIIGTVSGVVGIAITYILALIVNIIVYALVDIFPISNLPWWQALIMILISVLLNAISGFIPARSAAKKDPATALRTE